MLKIIKILLRESNSCQIDDFIKIYYEHVFITPWNEASKSYLCKSNFQRIFNNLEFCNSLKMSAGA